jgi:hypothetical protein
MSRFIRIRGIHEVAGQNFVFDPQFLKEGVRAIPPDVYLGGERQRGNFGFSPMENLPKRAYVKKFTIGERWRFSVREAGFRGEGVERERGFEPPTFGMASRCSAAKLLPQNIFANSLNPSFNFASKLSTTHG